MENSKVEFYKNSLKGDMVAALLTFDPDTQGGSNFLPANLSRSLVSEPILTNPLRQAAVFSAIKSLALPRVVIDFDDLPAIDDLTQALELEAAGSQTVFGRFKSKVKIVVSDTVLRGSEVDLAIFMENSLRNGLARLELARLLDQVPAEKVEHMSLFKAGISAQETEAAGLLAAIKGAIKDLPAVFRQGAQVLINSGTYGDLQDQLAGAVGAGVYSALPIQLLTKPAIFCDAVPADHVFVGDFSQLWFNYDSLVFDSQYKPADGLYYYVLTAWYDSHVLFKTAFRHVKIVVI